MSSVYCLSSCCLANKDCCRSLWLDAVVLCACCWLVCSVFCFEFTFHPLWCFQLRLQWFCFHFLCHVQRCGLSGLCCERWSNLLKSSKLKCWIFLNKVFHSVYIEPILKIIQVIWTCLNPSLGTPRRRRPGVTLVDCVVFTACLHAAPVTLCDSDWM